MNAAAEGRLFYKQRVASNRQLSGILSNRRFVCVCCVLLVNSFIFLDFSPEFFRIYRSSVMFISFQTVLGQLGPGWCFEGASIEHIRLPRLKSTHRHIIWLDPRSRREAGAAAQCLLSCKIDCAIFRCKNRLSVCTYLHSCSVYLRLGTSNIRPAMNSNSAPVTVNPPRTPSPSGLQRTALSIKSLRSLYSRSLLLRQLITGSEHCLS
jgi:hypothetical protein